MCVWLEDADFLGNKLENLEGRRSVLTGQSTSRNSCMGDMTVGVLDRVLRTRCKKFLHAKTYVTNSSTFSFSKNNNTGLCEKSNVSKQEIIEISYRFWSDECQ